MSSDFTHELNEVLISTFQSIERLEEAMIRKDNRLDLSINELHFIEAVGRNANNYPLGKTMTEISEILKITLASVTVGAGKLIQKGLLIKEKSKKDGRFMHLLLTHQGDVIYRLHESFHLKMVKYVTAGLSDTEKEIMLSGLYKLRDFFTDKLEV